MTPTLADILLGQVAALAAPAPPEAGGEYAAARLGMVGMLATLAVQEAERGIAARAWENGALQALFARAALAHDAALGGAIARAAGLAQDDLALSALDARNADLRRVLITLHEHVEGVADGALDREILDLYRQIAHHRRLDLPAALAG